MFEVEKQIKEAILEGCNIFINKELGVISPGCREFKPFQQVKLRKPVFFLSQPDANKNKVLVIFHHIFADAVHLDGMTAAVDLYVDAALFLSADQAVVREKSLADLPDL